MTIKEQISKAIDELIDTAVEKGATEAEIKISFEFKIKAKEVSQ